MKVQPWLTCWKHLYIVANQLSESQVSTLLAPPELHFSDRSSLEQLSRYALWSIVGRLKVQFSHIDSHLDKWIFIFPLSGNLNRPSEMAFCNFFLKTTQLLVVKPLWLAFLHLRLGIFFPGLHSWFSRQKIDSLFIPLPQRFCLTLMLLGEPDQPLRQGLLILVFYSS